MKKLATFLTAVTATVASFGGSYSFVPNPADLYDLDHSKAYSWGISGTQEAALANDVNHGLQITSATLTIKNIYDWTREANDHLYIDLLDATLKGVTTFTDYNPLASDFFNPLNLNAIPRLADWSDPAGGSATGFNLVVNLDTAQIAVLTKYLTNSTLSGTADFGLGFDPDCHYFNDGVSFVVQTGRASVADGGTTLILLGLGLSGLVFFRRFFRV